MKTATMLSLLLLLPMMTHAQLYLHWQHTYQPDDENGDFTSSYITQLGELDDGTWYADVKEVTYYYDRANAIYLFVPKAPVFSAGASHTATAKLRTGSGNRSSILALSMMKTKMI